MPQNVYSGDLMTCEALRWSPLSSMAALAQRRSAGLPVLNGTGTLWLVPSSQNEDYTTDDYASILDISTPGCDV